MFLGVRRPTLETILLPSTWHENGFGIFGDVGPVSYRSYVVDGFRGAGFTAGGLRGGRQGGNRALSEDLAWVPVKSSVNCWKFNSDSNRPCAISGWYGV